MSSHCFETRCDERWADMTEKPRTLHAHMVATCQSQEMPNLRRALLFVLLNINSRHNFQNEQCRIESDLKVGMTLWL